jgi:hypothetical protein
LFWGWQLIGGSAHSSNSRHACECYVCAHASMRQVQIKSQSTQKSKHSQTQSNRGAHLGCRCSAGWCWT